MAQLKHLFQPIRVGSMEVKNRVVMSGMSTTFGVEEDGCVTPQLIEYFVERARARPGMIILASAIADASGFPAPGSYFRFPRVFDDAALPGLQQLVQAVKQFDVRFGVQLTHYGILAQPLAVPWVAPWMKTMGYEATPMSVELLRQCVEGYAKSAERCLHAGFDFVEIEAAHPPALISWLLSPYQSNRTDEYGGSFENRTRFLLEVIRATRQRVGREATLGMRTMLDEGIGEKGWTPADAYRLAPKVEEAGIDYLSISLGTEFETIHLIYPSLYEPQGAFVDLAAELKKHVRIPVIVAGRIKDPVMADRILKSGKADLVIMGRAHLADPEIVDKARRGAIADIRPCLGDCLGCADQYMKGGDASCTVNPRVGREYAIKEIEGKKKAAAKTVLVAGAGPAGLEAARRAAFAGHSVVLCESRGWVGGQLRLASMMPKREEMGDILPWYERQLNRLGVEIRLNTTVDEDLLNAIKPAVLVIATGSFPVVPQGFLVGLENVKDIELMMIDELLEDERLTGDTVLILGGGNHMGLQLADYLSERGARVHIADSGTDFGAKMTRMEWPRIWERLSAAGVMVYRDVERVEVLAYDEVQMVSATGRQRLPDIETIVLAKGRRPNRFLVEVAEKKGIEVHIVGDASGVEHQDQGTVQAAIASGYDAGRLI
jgi:2,4-dienoyl-CoA reductase-like NADH-dependent reductase (Old Yellow Enzyme family)/thioredoxin reductase